MAAATSRVTQWLLAGGLGVIVSCGDDSMSAPKAAMAERSAPPAELSERLQSPTVADVLAALVQPHAAVREALGPHTLTTRADFSLTPAEPSARAAAVDQPAVTAQAVHDELTLHWGEPSPEGPRLRLSQSNDHDRGRDVVVLGETVHVRHAHRAWFHYPRDSDLLERWLDDAQRSVHDVVELAAPRLTLHAETLGGAGLNDGAAVEITLDLASSAQPDRVAGGPTQGWRTGAEIDRVQGHVRLDARTGIWLSADVNVSYRLTGADQQPLRGQVHIRGQVTPGAVEVQAPDESSPLPSRLRYDDEQRRLLDGLAAP